MRFGSEITEKALQPSGKMQQQELQPDEVTEKALQLFDEMQKQVLQPDWFTYSSLIGSREKCRMTERTV